MRSLILSCAACAALTAPATAANYPVSGRWGPAVAGQKGAIDCAGKRVIAFNGDTRTDSKGGVPAYRNRSVTADGPQQFRVVDEFRTARSTTRTRLTRCASSTPTTSRCAMQGGTLKLQRCK